MNIVKCYIITSQMHYYKHDGRLAEPQKQNSHICSDVPIHLRNQKCLQIRRYKWTLASKWIQDVTPTLHLIFNFEIYLNKISPHSLQTVGHLFPSKILFKFLLHLMVWKFQFHWSDKGSYHVTCPRKEINKVTPLLTLAIH